MKKTLCILSAAFIVLMFYADAYPAVEPVISVNGMSGTVNVAADSPVTVNVKLSPGENDGTDADWWLVCNAFGKWYYYTLDGNWTDIGDSLDMNKLHPIYQGKLFTMQQTDLLHVSQLPAGNYTLYFGVDMNMNGSLDKDSLVFGEVKVIAGNVKALQSDLTRNMTPDVSQSDLTELVSGNNSFAIDFYHAISGNDGNIVYSPYSISMALAMTYAGAMNETKQQMGNTLHFTLSQDKLHPAFNQLNIDLSGGAGNQKFELISIANSLWGQSDYPFLKSFLDVIAANYGAVLNRTDFIKAPEESRVTINKWVSDNTKEKITDLISPGVIDDRTRFVLVNAIYFNATWVDPFLKKNSYDDIFYLSDGSQIKIPTMHGTGKSYNYTQGDGYKAVELPYWSGAFRMVILLPDSGKFKDFEASLTPRVLNEILVKLNYTYIVLSMPKFQYESDSVSLKDTLSDMGMPIAFKWPGADFSGIDGTNYLYIGNVIHKALISVDENGTEAAAATAVAGLYGGGIPPLSHLEMNINRPFIYFIRDVNTGAILFMGRVVNPGN